MTKRAAARRYARALFDVSLKEADLRKVESDLESFDHLMRQHPQLEHVLLNPAVPAPRKKPAVVEVARRLGAETVVERLLAMLAERDRLSLVPLILDGYRARLLDHLGVMRAEVTTAVSLPAGRADAISRGLGALTGCQVTVATKVDPAIIGGVVAQIGSTVYDGSVRRQLERLRETLALRA